MENILKTTLIEFEDSSFIIDLVQNDNNEQFIQIFQTIQNESIHKKPEIKMNLSHLGELLEVLSSYQALMTKEKLPFKNSNRLAIQNRYLRGVSIADLAVQFDCKPELIKQILRDGNIEIVDYKIPRSYHRKFKRKKK